MSINRWNQMGEGTKDWLRNMGIAPKLSTSLFDIPVNKKGKYQYGKASLKDGNTDVLSGLQEVFGGTAEASQWRGGLDKFNRGLIDQFLPGNGVSESNPGYFNITTARQIVPRIRQMFGDTVADQFSTWVDAQIQEARPENQHTWKEMPQYQQDLVNQYMGAGPQAQASPGANWGGLMNSALPQFANSQQPINPMAAPTIQGLFAGALPNIAMSGQANPLNVAVQNAGLLGNIYSQGK